MSKRCDDDDTVVRLRDLSLIGDIEDCYISPSNVCAYYYNQCEKCLWESRKIRGQPVRDDGDGDDH